MVAVVGRVDRSMLMSEPEVVTALVVWLLPPVVVPPLASFVAPVVAVSVVAPEAVGVPLTGHEILAPAATVAGGTGEHAPTVTPGGSPVTEQVAFVAEAVAVALLVHLSVPLYATPSVAVAGNPDTSGVISEPVVVMASVVWLLPPVVAPPLVSLVAPVVAVSVVEPVAVGVPLTGHEMLAPAATVAGGTGEQVPMVTPGGNPETEQVAEAADAVAAALLVHLSVPL